MALLGCAAILAFPTMISAQDAPLNYPVAPHDDTTDTYFGIKVADPYRPLENDTAAATTAWVEAENAVTRRYLDAIPWRKAIHDRLLALNNYIKHGLPTHEADGHYYFYENDGLRNQSVLYRSDDAAGKTNREIFLDPNTLSNDGTVALTGVFISPDGKYTAYTISRSGSDWTEIFVMDTATRQQLEDHIVWAKFTGAAWHGNGFYYSAYPAPEDGKAYSGANYGHNVYYHAIGTPQAQDRLVYSEPDAPLHFHDAWVDPGQRIMAVSIGGQGNGNALVVRRLDQGEDAPWVTLYPSQDKYVDVIGVVNNELYLYTSVGAPNYCIAAVPLDDLRQDNWRIVVPDAGTPLVAANLVGKEHIILTYDHDAANHAYLYGIDGKQVREITLPTYGTVSFSTSRKHEEVYYSFSSFVYPAAGYSYDITSGDSTPLYSAGIEGFNPSDYVTEQVFVTSKDGTRVPMFVTRRHDIKADGTNPVYLYGYGGFNITLNPTFSPNRLVWLENGGIYVSVNLRGGAEYGEPWHLAGTLMNKLNVFDDFIAAAEYMQGHGWTKPELTTIEGGSNGGLLVGACVNLRPDLYAVAIPRVGVMDMMRYHLFTIGWNWAHDYGTSDDSEAMARYLLGYSPLHTIRNDGTPYPAILVTTADHDDRVVPAHSFKYAATLQQADTGKAPKLIRIDSKAGHGSGKPVGKVIDEWTDIYSFIFKNIGRTPIYAK